MDFELTEEILEAIQEAIDSGSETMVHSLTGDLHHADIAEIIERLDIKEGSKLLRFFTGDLVSLIIPELDDDTQTRVLKNYQPKEIAETIIANLESDDAVEVVSKLSDDVREEVITHINDIEHASDIVDLLSYDEGSAGSLMGKEFVIAKSHWTFKECIKEVRKQAAEFDDIYTLYVADNNEKLLGTLSLKKLLISPTQSKVEEFYNADVQFVKSTDNAEEVAYKMEKYDLIALPVLDDLYRLIGRITIDDVVDFIKEEADKDYQMASGITDDIDTNDSIWDITKARIPWLLIGMVGGLLGAQVIKYFEIGEGGAGQMAMFIPLIAAMGGNVGVQSSAIIVQGLANNSLANTKIIAKLSKEIGVAFLNGFICSVVLLIYGYIFIGQIDASIAISLSLFTVICVAAVFGTLIPLMLDKYKIDPALATGPFITTLNDVVGLAIYFTIGGLIIG